MMREIGDDAAQQADIDLLEKTAMEALLAARKRALTDEEIMAVAYSAHIANAIYKELRK